jgi:hypothetical protein
MSYTSITYSHHQIYRTIFIQNHVNSFLGSLNINELHPPIGYVFSILTLVPASNFSSVQNVCDTIKPGW